MIEILYLVALAGILALELAAGLLVKRPAHMPVTVRLRSKK